MAFELGFEELVGVWRLGKDSEDQPGKGQSMKRQGDTTQWGRLVHLKSSLWTKRPTEIVSKLFIIM